MPAKHPRSTGCQTKVTPKRLHANPVRVIALMPDRGADGGPTSGWRIGQTSLPMRSNVRYVAASGALAMTSPVLRDGRRQ